TNSSGTQYQYAGLNVNGSTTTVAALDYIGPTLRAMKDGTSYTDHAASTTAVSITKYVNKTATANCQFWLGQQGSCTATTEVPTADSKASSCTRYYSVLLATGGTSTVCNTLNALWGSSCPGTTAGYPAGAASSINSISDLSTTLTHSDNSTETVGPK